MLRHMVMYKFNDDIDKSKAGEKGRELAKAVRQQIPEAQSCYCGTNMTSASGDNYDIVLIADFENLDALARYKQHPAHKAFGAFCHSVSDKRAAIDFEI